MVPWVVGGMCDSMQLMAPLVFLLQCESEGASHQHASWWLPRRQSDDSISVIANWTCSVGAIKFTCITE